MSEEVWLVLGAWLSAGLTLAMYSFLYGDNPIFRAAEHFYIGVSTGYLIVLTWYEYLWKELGEPLFGENPQYWGPVPLLKEYPQYWVLAPALLGLLILARFIPKLSWLSKYAFAALMGWTAGVAIPRTVSQFLLAQVDATVKPLVARENGKLVYGWEQLWALVILVGVLAVLVHFFFSVEHNRPLRITARMGVLFLMVSFGAAFGSTTMARMSLLYGRFDELNRYAGSGYYYATPVLLLATVAGLVAWRMLTPREPES